MYYNYGMSKKEPKRVPNISIRVNREAIKLAKIEAAKADITIGEWLEAAIQEKIKRDKKD